MSLFNDQQELVSDVRAAMRESKAVLMVSPTGSGKTRIATHIIEAAKNKQSRIIFTVPRKDLMEQTSETFGGLGIHHSFIAAGKRHNPASHVFIGMVDTMAQRIKKLSPADLVIIDETHFGAGSLDAVIKHYKQSGAWLLGLSATPWKLSGKGLGCWYDTMVQGKSIRWLMDNGRLSDYRYFYGRTKPDLSQVGVTAGDYAKGQIADFMEHQGAIIGDCVTDYKLRCMGNIHLVRCASIKHSQLIAQAFRDAGIPAAHVDGETQNRKQFFVALAKRELLVLCFADLLNFGFDLAQAAGMDVCVESISDMKPSKSLAGQMQYWGRALRMKSKPAIINDHVNNYIEHQYPDFEREWTLEDREQGKRASAERAVATKQCPVCYFVHKPSPACQNCGHVYEIKSREIDEIDGDMVEMTKEEREEIKRQAMQKNKNEQASARTLEDLIDLGRRRGMSNPHGWARHVYAARGGKR